MKQASELPGSVVYHHSYISPVGPLYLAVTREGLVLRISYGPLNPELFPGLRLEENKYACGEVAYQLEEYFLGKRQRFDLSLHLDQGTDFQKDVWNRLLKIPFGSTMTYGEVAQKVGRRDASRAVGNAVGKNPLPILVPCHRVVPKAGGLGGYTARMAPSEDPDHGTKIKGFLLGIESALQKS